MGRLKSKVLWASIAALLLFVLKNWGLLDKIGLTDQSFNALVDLLFPVLIGFGIINNPTDPKNL